MPYIHLKTNITLSVQQQTMLEHAFGQAITRMGKSEAYLMLEFSDRRRMAFEGSDAPLAMLAVDLLGHPTANQYDCMTQAVTQAVTDTLSIPPSRIYVKYMETEHWGMQGRNF